MFRDFDDDEIIFADEDPAEIAETVNNGWKLLIVDDEKLVHHSTRIALDHYTFEERSLTFLSAYSGHEACEILEQNRDIAIVLLDVVMESDDAGLKVA